MSSIRSPSSSRTGTGTETDEPGSPAVELIELRLSEKSSLSGDGLRVTGPWVDVALPPMSPGVGDVLRTLAATGATEQSLAAIAVGGGGSDGIIGLHTILYWLGRAGALAYRAVIDGRPYATLEPQRAPFTHPPAERDGTGSLRLSRFAYLRRDEDQLVVESPRGSARLVLHDERAAAAISALALGRVDVAIPAVVVSMLQSCQALADDDEDFADPAGAVGWWEFHDLLFHARSRSGRHRNPYGGTFHRSQSREPPPLTKPPMSTDIVPLPEADVDRLCTSGAAFADVLGRRRSVRDYDDRPPTLQDLGAFLHLAARIQRPLTFGRPNEEVLSFRPSPGGGAIHELELYLVVGACEGLAPGAYHYDPLRHLLERLPVAEEAATEVLNLAWATADRRSRPQVYIGVTARFQRLQWKYESMVYAAILKNLGALYQTMYLVATALGQAPCALGGGRSDLLSEMLGLDYCEESQVGEFLLGRSAT